MRKEKEVKFEKEPEGRVVLHFFRHGKQEKPTEQRPDQETLLTPEGRLQSEKKGEKISPQPEVGLAEGSPRIRSQETALRVMLHEEISPEMSFEEVQKKIDEMLKGKKKVYQDPRLNFALFGAFGEAVTKAYEEWRLLPLIVYESDQMVKDLNDRQSWSYSKMAANIAEIIKKYVKIDKVFDRVVKENPEKYKEYRNQLERYLGSHQCVLESFIAKLLGKLEGPEARDEFVNFVFGGFAHTEGFQTEIVQGKECPEVKIQFSLRRGEKSLEKSLAVPLETLDEIVKEGQLFSNSA